MKGDISKRDILVTGGMSMVGTRVVELLSAKFSFFVTDLTSDNSLDITNASQVEKLIESSNPQKPILHFAAYTNVDGAEKQRGNLQGSAWTINVNGTKNIINACKKTGNKLINISTDFVFDGKAGPYGEDDQVAKSKDQICWYGWTKLQAEKQILEADIPYLILRISYPYRATFEPKIDFVRNIINRLENDNLYPMFDDQYLTPTFIDDLANAIDVLIENNSSGIYHIAINEVVTPYQVALKAAEIFSYDKKRVKKSSLVQFQNKNKNLAIRPQHGGLKTDKINKFLNFSNLENSLLIMKEQMGK